MKIIATITNCVQVGQNEFRDVSTASIFTEDSTIKEMVDWAKNYQPNATFSSLKFSVLSEGVLNG